MRRSTLLLLSGISFSALSPLQAIAQSAPASRAATAQPYADLIAEASRRFGIPATWIRAVVQAESAGNPRARSSAGAKGLMQIMPRTWAELRVRHNLGTDPYDPRDNILAGAAYLRELHDRYGSPGFLAAYNAGPGRYDASLNGRPLPVETRAYVAALLPTIGRGVIADPATVTAADPLVWTRGSLFVTQSHRTSIADVPLSEPPPPDTPTAMTVRDITAIEPRSTGLFVARTANGDAR